MLKKALLRLEPYPEHFERVEVTSLREEVEAWLEVLEAPSSAIRPPLPQIRLTSLSS
jgi:hypothetical protein